MANATGFIVAIWLLNAKTVASVTGIVILARYKTIRHYKLERLNVIHSEGILSVTISTQK